MIGGWKIQFGTWDGLTPEQQGRVLAIVAECGGEWSRNGHMAFRDEPEAQRCAEVIVSRVGVPPSGIVCTD